MESFSENKKNLILLIVLLVVPLPQLLIDMYLPALPDIKMFFGTSASLAQLSLPVYLVPYSVSMVIFGISSDIYGRKISFIIGLLIGFAGLLISTVSGSITAFLIGRAVQGMGVGAGASIIFPVLVDVFKEKRLLHAIIYTNIAYGLAPIIAPYLGGTIILLGDWRAIFMTLTVYTGLLLVIIKFLLPETHHARTGYLSVKKLFIDSKRLFTSMKFIFMLIILSCPWGFIITFNVDGPFIFQKIYGYTPYKYGELTLIMGCANIIGVIVARVLLKLIDVKSLVTFGSVYYFLVSLTFLFTYIFGMTGLHVIIVLSFLLSGSSGIVFGSIVSIALEGFENISGLASALFFSLTNIAWAFISYILTFIPYSVGCLVFVPFALSLLGLVLWCFYLYRGIKQSNLKNTP